MEQLLTVDFDHVSFGLWVGAGTVFGTIVGRAVVDTITAIAKHIASQNGD